jgi:hypothetical protein
MTDILKSDPLRVDNVLSVFVIVVTIGFAGYGALASMLAPLAA